MYILSGQTLTRAEWFRPETMALNLEERRSTATLTVGPEAPDISTGMWLLDDEEPGAGIVWRVKTVETQYNTETRTVQLEHIVQTLKDRIMFGEKGPKEITGNSGATTAGAEDTIDFILGYHTLWQKGTFASDFDNISNPYTFNGEDLLSAVETVLSSLPDAYIDFDLTSIPFKLNVKKAGSDVGCEMRMSRNIQTLRKTVDRSRMYTRLYPIGENNLRLNAYYVSQNESTYGTVERVETESSIKSKAALEAWATERLSRHSEPAVTVTISGLELSEATGEPLDRFQLNTKCRVPLPEYGTTIVEKVTKLSWSDKIREPEKVTVTLANQREDIASIINRMNKASRSAGRSQAKKDEDDHAWIVDDKDHIALVAEKVFGSEFEGQNWSQVSALTVNGDGIYGAVTQAQNDIVVSKGELIIEKDRAALVVTAKDNREILCYANTSKFPATGNAQKIYLATNDGKYYEWKNGAYTEIAKADLHKVHTGNICTAINDSDESDAIIQADHVKIGATQNVYTLAGAFDYTEDGKLYIKDAGGLNVQRTQTVDGVETTAYFGVWDKNELTGGVMAQQINGQTVTRIRGDRVNIGNSDGSSNVSISDALEIQVVDSTQRVKIKKPMWASSDFYLDGNLYQSLTGSKYIQTKELKLVGSGGSQGASVHSLTDSDIKEMIIKASVSGNTLTLWTYGSNTAQTSGDGIITFNKAASQSTTIKGTWGSGIYTVSATPAASGGESPPISTTIGFDSDWATWNGAELSMPIRYNDPINDVWIATGLVAKYTVDNLSAGNIKSGVTIGGVQGSYTGASYASGWEDCYDDIGLNYVNNQTLGFGGSVTVYPAAKNTPTAQHASITQKGITVTAVAYWLHPTSDAVTANGGDLQFDQRYKISDGPDGAALAVWQVPKPTIGFKSGFSTLTGSFDNFNGVQTWQQENGIDELQQAGVTPTGNDKYYALAVEAGGVSKAFYWKNTATSTNPYNNSKIVTRDPSKDTETNGTYKWYYYTTNRDGSPDIPNGTSVHW